MRIRMIIAAGLGAATLAMTALLAAPAARADVGAVDITFYNASGTIIGVADDGFDNLNMAQCDGNNLPSGTASATVTNLSDQTVQVGSSCNDLMFRVRPGRTFPVFDPPGSSMSVFAPAGA